MAEIRRVKTKTRYCVLDSQCIGRDCLVLGVFQHRSMMTVGGSRNTGDVTACCMTRAYRGCPLTEAKMQYDEEVAKERKAEGWRVV